MSVTVKEFLGHLEDSQLFSPDEVKEMTDSLTDFAPEDSGQEFAKALVKQDKLTPYQARAIYNGKPKGLVFGNYLVLDKLGQGGMGMVFKARHRVMERIVALKILSPQVTRDKKALQRFHREVKTVGALFHPNIVAAHDADESKGVHFLVMEFVDGKDLSELVKAKGTLSVEQGVDCILQSARGLAHAHEQGIIHRDIKPSNLLLEKTGRIKILDLGLARVEEGPGGSATGADITNTGTVMGTVDYMSPEQALDTKGVNQQTDIYSLGCTLFYLMTGRPVFDGDTVMKKLLAHREEPAPSLKALRTDVTPELDAVYQKMIAKKQAERYQTMQEVIADLEQIQSGKAVPANLLAMSLSDASLSNSEIDFTSSSTTAYEPPGSSPDTEKTARGTDDFLNEDLTEAYGGETDPIDEQTVAGYRKAPLTRTRPAQNRSKKKPKQQTLTPTHWAMVIGASSVAILLAVIIWATTRSSESSNPDDTPSISQTETVPPGNSNRQTTPPPTDNSRKKEPKPLVAPFDAKRAEQGQQAWASFLQVPVRYNDRVGISLNLIPPGTFESGISAEDLQSIKESVRKHGIRFEGNGAALDARKTVQIEEPFYLAANEITREQYLKVMTSNMSPLERGKAMVQSDVQAEPELRLPTRRQEYNERMREPAIVTWLDAIEFCNRLSHLEHLQPYYQISGQQVEVMGGEGYFLPAIDDWEYACNAGSTGPHYGTSYKKPETLERYAWFSENSNGQPHPVGLKSPNAFGLYDLHGNAAEWCEDRSSFGSTWRETWRGNRRKRMEKFKGQNPAPEVIRVNEKHTAKGGSFESDLWQTRTSQSVLLSADEKSGFRVAREVPEKFIEPNAAEALPPLPPPPPFGPNERPPFGPKDPGQDFRPKDGPPPRQPFPKGGLIPE